MATQLDNAFCPTCYRKRYADLEIYETGTNGRVVAFKCLGCGTVHYQSEWEELDEKGYPQYSMKKFWKIVEELKKREAR